MRKPTKQTVTSILLFILIVLWVSHRTHQVWSKLFKDPPKVADTEMKLSIFPPQPEEKKIEVYAD